MSRRLIIYVIAFFASFSLLIYRYKITDSPSDFLKETLVSFAITGIVSSFVGFIELYLSHQERFWNTIKCKFINRNRLVYVSLSYLLQIKIKGSEKYFLVRGSKHAHQYQPVGGVYKHSQTLNIEDEWKAEYKNDKENKYDLRLFTKAKYVPEIINWFESNMNREIGVWREFKEEVLDTNILSKNTFNHLDIEFLCREEKLMEKENRYSNEEYHTILYDIFRVNLTVKQEKELTKLMDENKCNEKFAFVSSDEIKKEICSTNNKIKIGEHSKYIINN